MSFEDLSVEDKAKVIGGLAMAGLGLVVFFVFIQLIVPEYSHRFSESLNSGSSIFTILPSFIVLMYLFIVPPMAVAGMTVGGLLAKRSFGYVMKGILLCLLVPGTMFLVSASLFALFGLIFSTLSVPAQFLLVVFACFVSSMTMAFVLRTKTVSKYLKKPQSQMSAHNHEIRG